MPKLYISWLTSTFLTLFALLSSGYCIAQQNIEDPSFINISLPDLESVDGVFAIAQDKQGFMWFGGKNGLRRFDGYKVEVFRHNPQDANSISSNDVSDILVDSKGRLWVALLSGGGLNQFDYAHQSFIRYEKDNSNPQSIGSADIYALAEDKAGDLWLATHDNGLNRLDHKTGNFKRFAIALPGVKDSGVRDIAIDGLSNIWVATNSQGLYKVNPDRDQFFHYEHIDGDPTSLSDDKLYKVYCDRYNNIWLGTVSGGVSRLDQSKGEFTTYRNNVEDTHVSEEKDIGAGMIWDIAEDAKGSIWFATGSGTLSRYNKWQNSFDNFYPDSDNRNQPSGKTIKIFLDKTGNLWLGSYFSKLNIVNEQGDKFKTMSLRSKQKDTIKNYTINDLAESQDGSIWIATNKGFGKVTKSGESVNFLNSEQNIDALILTKKNNIWLGTGYGIEIYNFKENSFENLKLNSDVGKSNFKVWHLLQDSEDLIWVATQNQGLYQINPKTREVTNFQHDALDDTSLNHSYVWTVFEDRKRRLWVGTLKGLNLFDRSNGHFIHSKNDKKLVESLKNNSVRAIAEDRDGNIWLGTGSGLIAYNPEKNTHINFGVEQGLADESITSIVVDDQGFVWVTTQKGISRINRETREVRNYDARHGISGSAFPRRASALVKRDGNLLFAGVFGLTTVNVNNFQQNSVVPPVVLTGFYVNGKKIQIEKNGILKKDINETKKITLSPKQNAVAIEFSALNYVLPEQNKYKYKLVGFDKHWQYTDASQRKATYTNLTYGDYTFLVKGSNNEGVWNTMPTQLELVILAPWWFNFWLLLVYFSLALTAIIFVIRDQRKRANDNLLLRSKVSEIEQQKKQFLANIANDLTPPLNTILGLTENILKNGAGDISPKAKQHVTLIKEESHKILLIASDVLDYSSFNPNSDNMNLRLVYLDQILEGTVQWFRPKAEEKSLKLYLSIEGDLPQIKVDYGSIQKILYILIANAIKYTLHGYIDVVARQVDEHVLIQIADTGTGIDKNKISMLFIEERLSKGQGEVSHPSGLVYAKKLIELNGGSIYLDSTSEKGSMFIIHFPAALTD